MFILASKANRALSLENGFFLTKPVILGNTQSHHYFKGCCANFRLTKTTRRYGRWWVGRSTRYYIASWFIWFYWWCLKYIHSKILSSFLPFRQSILEWLEFANLTKGVLTNSGTIGPHFSRPDSIALFLAITHFTLMKSNPPRALLMDTLSMEFSQRQTIPSLEVPSVDSLSKISLKG